MISQPTNTRAKIMGVLNVTPDSFFDGGLYFSPDAAQKRAEQIVEEGADIIDIGGESTRPGAKATSISEQLHRVIPVVEFVKANFDITISVDTSAPDVMQAALEAGADMINDIRALQMPGACEVVLQHDVPCCLMHMQGQPDTMQIKPQYDSVVDEIIDFLQQRIEATGLDKKNIILDPGFGFGKNPAHYREMLQHLHRFVDLGYPVLVGFSRKSWMERELKLSQEERLTPGIALAVLAQERGASIVRTHDVKLTKDALAMAAVALSSYTNEAIA